MTLAYKIARQKLRVCAEWRKKYYDSRVKPQSFEDFKTLRLKLGLYSFHHTVAPSL